MFKLPLWLCLISFASLVQATDDMVVIHSYDTKLFAIGQILDSHTTEVNLINETDKVTVVFASGGVQTLEGPYQGTFIDPLSNHKPDPALLINLAEFLTRPQETIRSGTPPQPDEIWRVDVSTRIRFYCIAPSSNRVVLWRPDSQSQTSTITIKHKRSGREKVVKWPARKTTLEWPSDLPVFYGEDYTVNVKTGDGSSFKKLVLYQLPDSLPTESHKLVWMVGRGCIPQANMLLATLR